MAETPSMLPPSATPPSGDSMQPQQENVEIKISVPKDQIEQLKAVFSQINDTIQGSGDQGQEMKPQNEEGAGDRDPLAGFAEELNAK